LTVVGALPIGKAKALKLTDDLIELGEYGSKGALAERITSCMAKSFSGDTRVLMADGSAKPIKDIKVGDKVLATDPKNGKKKPRKVTHVWVHKDQLVNLNFTNGKHLTTTDDHPFWNETDRQWQEARQLSNGDQIFTGTPAVLTVEGLDWAAARQNLSYNLTVADLHTYYVLADGSPVLVHNFGSDIPQADDSTLQNQFNRLFHGSGNPIQIGDGTALGAANDQFHTGKLLYEQDHIESTGQARNAINNWLTKDGGTRKKPIPRVRSAHDIELAKGMIGAIDAARSGTYTNNLSDYLPC
jgi:hypothetical protein